MKSSFFLITYVNQWQEKPWLWGWVIKIEFLSVIICVICVENDLVVGLGNHNIALCLCGEKELGCGDG